VTPITARMVYFYLVGYLCSMALNIKDAETEQLAAEVAALAAETKTRAINVALRERRARLVAARTTADRGERLRRFLTEEAWPQIPTQVLGIALSKAEREEILGYGPEGV
jgi:antitoxin VapB